MTEASTCPAPPWPVRGDAIALPLVRIQNGRLLVGAQAWLRYADSPVGPYDEYFAVLLRRVGKSWGPHVVEMPVTLEESRRCGRAIWGFPKTLRAMKWTRRGQSVRFQNRNAVRYFRLSRWSVPVAGAAWAVQVLEGRTVRVPFTGRGRARLCWSGRRLGVCVEGFEAQVLGPREVGSASESRSARA